MPDPVQAPAAPGEEPIGRDDLGPDPAAAPLRDPVDRVVDAAFSAGEWPDLSGLLIVLLNSAAKRHDWEGVAAARLDTGSLAVAYGDLAYIVRVEPSEATR